MSSQAPSLPSNKSSIIHKPPRALGILLIVLLSLAIVAFLLTAWSLVYCSTVASCDDFVRPAMSSEMMSSLLRRQYQYAVQDIDAGRLAEAQQRLSYILFRDPEYPGANERLQEVEQLLAITPPPSEQLDP